MGKNDIYLARVLEERKLRFCDGCGKELNRHDIVYKVITDNEGNKRALVKIICSECLMVIVTILSWYPTVNNLWQATAIIEEEILATSTD